MDGAGEKNILLVEDSATDTRLAEIALAEYGSALRLWVVSTGEDALMFLHKEGVYQDAPLPALVLLDLNLPRVRGDDVLAELRRLPSYEQIPVVVLSSTRREEEKQRCLRLGANAVEQKPLELDAYFATLHAILARWLLGAKNTEPERED